MKELPINQIICGNALAELQKMLAESVDMCMTSPPYYGLRDYGIEQIFGGDKDCKHDWNLNPTEHDALRYRGHNANVGSNKNPEIHKGKEGSGGQDCCSCGAWRGQLGLEPTPEMYIEHLTEIFNEVKRVLKKEGTLWLNISDTYAGSGGAGGDYNLTGLREGQPKHKQGKIFDNKYKKIDAAWLAAFIDSEGTIQIHKQKRDDNSPAYQPHIAIAMVQREMLDNAYSITKLGSVWKMNYKTSSGKNVYQWSVRGQQGKELIEQIYSYLILKKKQAAILWMLCGNLKDKKDGKRVKPENLKYREILYNAVKELNQLRDPNIKIIEPIKSKFQSKCLLMIPERLAWSLIQNDWVLRNKIVWFKPNSMPSSVKDRFSNRWEYLFMFSKSQRYYFDLDGVRVPHAESGIERAKYPLSDWKGASGQSSWCQTKDNPDRKLLELNPVGKNLGDIIETPSETRTLGAILGTGKAVKVPGGKGWTGHPPGGEHKIKHDSRWCPPEGKNPGDFFEINTQPFPEAHFAVFPEALCIKPIKAGCPEEVCKKCGRARERITINQSGFNEDENCLQCKQPKSKHVVSAKSSMVNFGKDKRVNTAIPCGHNKTIGWTSCKCNAGFDGGIILDPFAGTGTVGLMAKNLNRRYILIDIKKEYCEMAEKRIGRWLF